MSAAARNLRYFMAQPLVGQILRGGHATCLRLGTTAITLVFGILGARLLGAEVFGAYVSLGAIAGLATVALSIGLPDLLGRELAASRGSGDFGALKPLTQGLLATNAALAVAVGGALVLGWADVGIVLGLALMGNAAAILAAVYTGQERVLLGGWLSGVVRLLVALVALWLLAQLLQPSVRVPLLAQLIGTVTALMALLAFWRGPRLMRAATEALRANRWSERHRSIWRRGLMLAATQVLINLTTQIDILLLTAMTSPQEVAHYYAAARAALVVSFFLGPSAMLAEPTLARLLAQGDVANARQITERTARAGFALTLLASAAALVVAPYYLAFYGPSFTAAMPALLVVLAGLLGWSLFGPAQTLMRAARQDAQVLRHTAVALMVNSLLSVALIPMLGITGAAVGTACQFVVYGALLSQAAESRTSIRTRLISLGSWSKLRTRDRYVS